MKDATKQLIKAKNAYTAVKLDAAFDTVDLEKSIQKAERALQALKAAVSQVAPDTDAQP